MPTERIVAKLKLEVAEFKGLLKGSNSELLGNAELCAAGTSPWALARRAEGFALY